MRIVYLEDVYHIKKGHNQSLWSFLESDQSNSIVSAEEKKEFKSWINKINYHHHNDANFFDNLKNIFLEDDGACHLLLGQEDVGAISLNNCAVIVRHAEMGVSFSLAKNDSNPINKEDWENYKSILSALDLGFINAKDFHLLKSFDKMNKEIKLSDSKKENKVKI